MIKKRIKSEKHKVGVSFISLFIQWIWMQVTKLRKQKIQWNELEIGHIFLSR